MTVAPSIFHTFFINFPITFPPLPLSLTFQQSYPAMCIYNAWRLVKLDILLKYLQLGCGMAQTVARRIAVWQARVRISARHPWGGPLPSGSNEEIKSGTRLVLYIKILYVCSVNVKIKYLQIDNVQLIVNIQAKNCKAQTYNLNTATYIYQY
jgi:hypothetical protein